MDQTVFVKSYPPPPLCRREILRYAGINGDAPEITGLLEECLKEAADKLSYTVCWRAFSVETVSGMIDLGFARTASGDLRRNLEGCHRIILFGATVGLGIDTLIARYSRLSPVKALLFQAIGAERIESLCDIFNEEIQAQARRDGLTSRPRFSPGYGDLPLELQRDIFLALDCPRKIGLTLNDSLLMSPTKSVTAIIGLGPTPCGHSHGV